jgi:hypothetical protein
MRTINLHGEVCESARDAIQHRNAAGWEAAILINGQYICTTGKHAERLQATGVPFAYIEDHEGCIITVPVN